MEHGSSQLPDDIQFTDVQDSSWADDTVDTLLCNIVDSQSVDMKMHQMSTLTLTDESMKLSITTGTVKTVTPFFRNNDNTGVL